MKEEKKYFQNINERYFFKMWKICFCFLSQAARVSQWCNYPLVSCMKPFIRCHSERKNLTETKVRRICNTCVRRFDVLKCKFRPLWSSDTYVLWFVWKKFPNIETTYISSLDLIFFGTTMFYLTRIEVQY